MEALDAALWQKLTLIEHFSPDNALLRNSLMYLLHAGQALRSKVGAAGYETVAAEVGDLSHGLLRFLQTPDPLLGEEIIAIMDRLPSPLPLQSDLSVLVAHGKLIVDVLPQVDALLRQLMAAPTMTHAQALREATLQYYGQRDFARPRTPGLSETFVLNEAVRRALRLLTPLIWRKTAHFHVALAAEIPPVQGESQHVEQIVVNLVVNALEALPTPGRRVIVSTRFEPAECCVFLAVEDEGIGIPPDHQARLCDPFFTTKHESGGTGLGLAITSTLVRAHGGRLTFSSEPGRGTPALVMLPCLSKGPPLQAELASHPPTGPACSRNAVP